MKRKIALTVLGTVLFVGCASTAAHSPSPKWTPTPEQSFTEFITPKPSYDTLIDYIPTPAPSRVEIRVQQPKPKSSVTRYNGPRSHVNTKVVLGVTGIKKYALDRIGSYQFSCLNLLWNHESGWNYTRLNKYSGAYGIPQALPGSKMATFGSDWKTNPITQIKWGLHYVNGRYGSACGAWDFWFHHHWY